MSSSSTKVRPSKRPPKTKPTANAAIEIKSRNVKAETNAKSVNKKGRKRKNPLPNEYNDDSIESPPHKIAKTTLTAKQKKAKALPSGSSVAASSSSSSAALVSSTTEASTITEAIESSGSNQSNISDIPKGMNKKAYKAAKVPKAAKPKKTPKEDGRKKKPKKEKKVVKNKEKPPVDVEKQCGVKLTNGDLCARSLTCKTHSMGTKRAVQGRSAPYDVLLAAYQKKNQVKMATLSAQQQLEQENAQFMDDVPLDDNEEFQQVMAGVTRSVAVPVEHRVIMPSRSRTGMFRMREMLISAFTNANPAPIPVSQIPAGSGGNAIMAATGSILGRSIVYDAVSGGQFVRPSRAAVSSSMNMQQKQDQKQQSQQQQQQQQQHHLQQQQQHQSQLQALESQNQPQLQAQNKNMSLPNNTPGTGRF